MPFQVTVQVRRLGFALCMTLPLISAQAAPPASVPGAANFPLISLPDRTSGDAAVTALGNNLPAVAAYYGFSTAEFARMLRQDSSARIDKKGRLLFVDTFPEPADAVATDTLEPAPFPLEDTFTLHSRPGAKRVIYLDFNGHSTSGTAWNSGTVDPIISPAYTQDSDPAFSNNELTAIQNMWRQVAEDFAPFDVNVTTEDPGQAAITRSGSSDEYYGTRVVVTKDNFDGCGCGGFAYVGVFNSTGDYYKPAFVFNTGVVGAGEAITHETGHNLGLSHDGTSSVNYYQGHGSGDTGWAPIMGVGYYQKLVQWSRGEYGDANNTEDDIARIQLYGAPLTGDDHGNSNGAATALDATANGGNASLSGNGLIHQSGDVDVFSFLSGAGGVNLNVSPVPVSPNLDVRADLYDSVGALIASANPAASLPASLSLSLAAGEYFLHVDGVGKGDPQGSGYTDYGSLGHYAISGTAPNPQGLAAPSAVAVANYTPGFAELTVNFDGSASSDSDGEVTDWSWDFGDGSSGSGDKPVHTYTSPGNYVATLTVTDNDSLTGSDTAQVTVDNRVPVAVASASPLTGTAPLTVDFFGSDSYDPDLSGSISDYSWTFGDGAGRSDTDLQHNYTVGGEFTATLTVSDNLGASHSTSVDISVASPPFFNQYASAEELGAGTVSGTLEATKAADNNMQVITERESGGRKSGRHSYLEHTWVFNVQGGSLVTLYVTANGSSSNDGDSMLLSYSINGGSFQEPAVITLATEPAMYSASLPTSGGTVRVRVTDSDQTAGNRSLDSVSIDEIYVRTDNGTGQTIEPPNPAYNTLAQALSANEIQVSWSDGSSDELGFHIERSDDDGGNWVEAGSTGVDQTSFVDYGLAPATNFGYRVVAFNAGGDASPSNSDYATTHTVGISLEAIGSKRRGVMNVDLSWEGLDGGSLYRNGVSVGTVSGNSYFETLGKGGGTFSYQICSDDSRSNCSNTAMVVF